MRFLPCLFYKALIPVDLRDDSKRAIFTIKSPAHGKLIPPAVAEKPFPIYCARGLGTVLRGTKRFIERAIVHIYIYGCTCVCVFVAGMHRAEARPRGPHVRDEVRAERRVRGAGRTEKRRP